MMSRPSELMAQAPATGSEQYTSHGCDYQTGHGASGSREAALENLVRFFSILLEVRKTQTSGSQGGDAA